MKNMKNKSYIAITILITLLLATSTLAGITFSAFPPPGTQIPSYSKINVGPNPSGVNQVVTVNIFHAIPMLTSELYANMTVEVTDPTGHTTTLGPFTSDTTGGTFTNFTPDQVGIWRFQMFYPGQTDRDGHIQMPDESEVFELTVQVDPVTRESYPATPAPQNYWETPVSAMNSENWYWHMGEWWGLSSITFESTGGNLYGGNYNPYTDSVNSGHVLWTKPWGAGGVAGGEAGPDQISGHYWTTRQYQPQYAPIIMQGVMYATLWTTSQRTAAQNGIVATDLFTGETLWTIDTYEELECGWEPVIHNINEYGVRGPYLLTYGDHEGVNTTRTTLNIYDATTGKYMASIINATVDVWEIDESRDLKGYFYTTVNENGTTTRYLNRWDMSTCLNLNGNSWGLTQGREYEFTRGIEMTAPMVDYATIQGVTDTAPLEQAGFTGGAVRLNGITNDECVFTGGFTFGQGFGGTTNGWLVVFAMDKNTGAQLWARNVTYTETTSMLPYTRQSMTIHDGLWININLETYRVYALDTRTGQQAFSLTLTGDNGGLPHYYNSFGLSASPGPGVTIIRGFGGDLWCIDDYLGTVRWYTNSTKLLGAPGAENPYTIWPFWVFGCEAITNNVAYLPVGHEYNPPMFPGAQMVAVNITDGSLVWSEVGTYIRSTSIAYDILLSLNAYDNQIYAFGKGPSAITVEAPNYGVTLGTPVTIGGTIMDVSAGVEQSEVAKRFPNGLPCISDEDQSHFMEYVYQEQTLDYNPSGVEIVISTIDPNGNTYELGRTTSDESGSFGVTIEPPVPGDYKIIATFEGTDSYWGSRATSYMYVGEPPTAAQQIEPEPTTPEPTTPEPTTPEPTEPEPTTPEPVAPEPTEPEPTEPAETPFITTEIAILAAVAIAVVIGIAAFWALKKRK